MQSSDCSSMEMEHREGQRTWFVLWLRADFAFGNSIFMDCGRMCFVPALMEPGPGISDGKRAIQKNCPFYSVLNHQSNVKEHQFCPKSPLKYIWQWSLESGDFGKIPVERYFPSCVRLSLCPLFSMLSTVKKCFFFFSSWNANAFLTVSIYVKNPVKI